MIQSSSASHPYRRRCAILDDFVRTDLDVSEAAVVIVVKVTDWIDVDLCPRHGPLAGGPERPSGPGSLPAGASPSMDAAIRMSAISNPRRPIMTPPVAGRQVRGSQAQELGREDVDPSGSGVIHGQPQLVSE